MNLKSYSHGLSYGFPVTVTGNIRKVEIREAAIEELCLQEIAKVRTL